MPSQTLLDDPAMFEPLFAKYWGPMTNVRQVRSAVRFIAGLFQLRTCKLELDGKKFVSKPCLDYHLKLCSAPCVNYIDREEYRKLVRFAVDFPVTSV